MSIYFNEQNRTFYLESKDVSYIFGIDQSGFLHHLYYGKKINREDLWHTTVERNRGHSVSIPGFSRGRSLNVLGNECPLSGRGDFRESMLLMDQNGVRTGALVYQSHQILKKKPELAQMPSVRGGETLVVKMFDALRQIEVALFYTVFTDLPVILRHVEITNHHEHTLSLNRAYSFCVDYVDDNWESICLPGAHVRERHIERNKLKQGCFTIGSSRGVSSGQMNPFLAIVRPYTTEDVGEAYGYNFVYSGDYVFKAQIEENDTLRVVGGINDYDFCWKLEKNETFVAPEMVMVYSDNGLNKMSQAFHDLYRNYLIDEKHAKAHRPIVINNWEATYMSFTEEKLCRIIESVKGTGIDTFVLDDGWFGVRNTDTTGLGDWFINYDKLPNGFKNIIACAHNNGLKFGLWFEPEMVSKDSDLYRLHPEWAIQIPGLEPCPGRDQLVLDMSRQEVVDYLYECISKILKENEIDYVKWDMNRSLADNYSQYLKENSVELHHRYVLNFYQLAKRLTNDFPNVFFEGCASGGCRFDPAMMAYFPQIWTSDDTDCFERTMIQYGTSLCYPLSSMSDHVSVCPNHQTLRISPMQSRAHVAHLGATGYELDTTKLDESELTMIKEHVAQYKEMQDLMLCGDFYRLVSPFEDVFFAGILVAKDKSNAHLTVVKGLHVPNGKTLRVYPRGLDPKNVYFVPELSTRMSGASWMNAGFVAELPFGDFTSKTYKFVKE